MQAIKNLLKHKKKLFLILSISWTLLLTVLSLFSVSKLPDVKLNTSDKVIHAFFYLILTIVWLLYFYFNNKSPLKNSKIFIISSVFFVYGIIIEVLQGVLPYKRSADIKDVLANAVGILIAIFVFKIILINSTSLKTEN